MFMSSQPIATINKRKKVNRLKQGIYHLSIIYGFCSMKKNKRKLLNRLLTYDFNITKWGLSLGDC
jgi:hypothetical protein